MSSQYLAISSVGISSINCSSISDSSSVFGNSSSVLAANALLEKEKKQKHSNIYARNSFFIAVQSTFLRHLPGRSRDKLDNRFNSGCNNWNCQQENKYFSS